MNIHIIIIKKTVKFKNKAQMTCNHLSNLSHMRHSNGDRMHAGSTPRSIDGPEIGLIGNWVKFSDDDFGNFGFGQL
jgi:hypothetical protein